MDIRQAITEAMEAVDQVYYHSDVEEIITLVEEKLTPTNTRIAEIADSIQAACFPEPGAYIMPRESWLKTWLQQLRKC